MTRAYTRPMPPQHLWEPGLGFARAAHLEEFVRAEFLTRGGLFFDAEHGHLSGASVGFLWASSAHVDKGSTKAGIAQLIRQGEPRKWTVAARAVWLQGMFGPALPTFLITLSAPVWARYDDRQAFALVDHELCHCAVAKDEYGAPRFSDGTGQPVWCTRPHDHEGFVGTVDRWGAGAAGAAPLVSAALRAPRFAWVPGSHLDVYKACGT
ncbi:MAG: hypothetical protein JWM27_4719 [Gemmatimonadetes bacterium]|nr:hypothetical protein [Gemmatimonadota bacterium]